MSTYDRFFEPHVEPSIFERVRIVICKELKIDPDKVTREAKFRGNRLRADSLDLINLIIAFAIEFGVEMKDEEIQKVVTVDDMVHYIESAEVMV